MESDNLKILVLYRLKVKQQELISSVAVCWCGHPDPELLLALIHSPRTGGQRDKPSREV